MSGSAAKAGDSTWSSKYQVGMRIEREIDNLWFSATVKSISKDGTYEICYDDDGIIETGIHHDEIRMRREADHSQQRIATVLSSPEKERIKESLLLPVSEYDPNKQPVAVVHSDGVSHDPSFGYVINGSETNIAAGNGLRGVRWLKNTV